MTLKNPTGRTALKTREQALADYYDAERRAGTPPLLANERMHFFGKRLDALHKNRCIADDAFSRDLAIIRQVMESK